MYIARTRAASRAGSRQARVAAGGGVAAVVGGAPAPAAAAGERAVEVDDEVGAVVDELGVEAHDGAAGGDLRRGEERPLQLADRGVHQRRERGQVGGDGEAVGEAAHAGASEVPRSR